MRRAAWFFGSVVAVLGSTACDGAESAASSSGGAGPGSPTVGSTQPSGSEVGGGDGVGGATGGGNSGGAGDGGDADCSGSATEDPQLAEALDLLREQLEAAGAPGGALAVVQDGEVLGMGVVGSKIATSCDPITLDTMFRAGVMAQVVTTLAVLDAVEDGVLSIDQPVKEVVDDLHVDNGEVGDFTLHHLLTFSAMYRSASDALNGLSCSTLHGSVADAVDPLQYASPGTMMDYNLLSSIEIPGLALEIADDVPYPEAARARVLDRLGMGGTFDQATFMAGDHATGHRDGPVLPLPDCPNRHPSEGYNASIRDLARLAQYLTGGAGDVLGEEMLDAMLSRQGDGFHPWYHATYGAFGEEQAGDEYVTTGSWFNGYFVNLALFRERRLAVVVIGNADRFDLRAATNGVLEIFDPTIAFTDPPDVEPDPDALATLVGTYVDPLGFGGSGERALEIVQDPDDPTKLLATSVIDGVELPIEVDSSQCCPDNFVFSFGGVTKDARFWRDEEGHVYALQTHQDSGPPYFRQGPL